MACVAYPRSIDPSLSSEKTPDRSPNRASSKKTEKSKGSAEYEYAKAPLQEEKVAGKDSLQGAWIFLSGLPSRSALFWTTATVAVNALLLLFTIDAVYRAPYAYPSNELSFVRIGHVSDTGASILVREPDAAQLPLYFSYRSVGSLQDPVKEDSWKSAGRVYLLSNETDYTYTVRISDLHPSTQYQYAVSNNLTGYFTTAPSIGTLTPGSDTLTFLTSSCIKPRFPYNPLHHPLSVPGFKQLAKWIPSLQAPFMLFLGDFIYVDVPRRLGYDAETYRREYRQVYASPDWPSVSTNLRWLHVLDDHEIANDWDSNTSVPYPAAVDPWHLYHTSINPPPADTGASYFTFTHGPGKQMVGCLFSFSAMLTPEFTQPVFSSWTPAATAPHPF